MLVHSFRLAILIFFISVSASAQIINIESQRFNSDSIGWSGNWNLSANYTKNTNQLFTLSHNLAIKFSKGRSTWLFLNTINGSYANQQVLQNRLLGHLRYNYRQNKWLTYEALLQAQRNVPLKIEQRILAGAGPRFTLLKQQRKALNLGSLLLYEEDSELEREVVHHDLRLSTYLAFSYRTEGSLSLNTVAYYQPRIDKWEDYRLSLQTQLGFKILKNLAFISTLTLAYDAFPAYSESQIPKLTIEWTNGISYRF